MFDPNPNKVLKLMNNIMYYKRMKEEEGMRIPDTYKPNYINKKLRGPSTMNVPNESIRVNRKKKEI
jgi:hypothetical protein